MDLLSVQGTLKSEDTRVKNHQFFDAQLFYGPTLTSIYDYWKNHSFHSFSSKEQCLLNSWLQSPSVVILEAPKIKSVTVSTVYPSVCHDEARCHDLSVLNIKL